MTGRYDTLVIPVQAGTQSVCINQLDDYEPMKQLVRQVLREAE